MPIGIDSFIDPNTRKVFLKKLKKHAIIATKCYIVHKWYYTHDTQTH